MPEQPVGTHTKTRADAPPATSESEARPPARFTRLGFEQIFKRMVADELQRGPLPYRRRRKLMRYAAQIGIKPFQASLLIAEAQREAGHLDDIDQIDVHDAADVTTLIHPERWPLWFKLTAALIVAIIVDLMIIRAIG